MTSQQLIAITLPCRLAEQCAHPRYRRVTVSGPRVLSVILTLNNGRE